MENVPSALKFHSKNELDHITEKTVSWQVDRCISPKTIHKI